MDFIDEPLMLDHMGPLQHIKYTFGSLISNLCSKLRNHISNKDIHVTAEDKKKWDDLVKKVEELTATVNAIQPSTSTDSASSSVLNNDSRILEVVDAAGYLKDIPVCYVTKAELPFLIAS